MSRYHIGEMMGVYLEPRDGIVTLILQGTQVQLVACSPRYVYLTVCSEMVNMPSWELPILNN